MSKNIVFMISGFWASCRDVAFESRPASKFVLLAKGITRTLQLLL